MPKDVTKNEKKEKKHFFRNFKAELKKVIWPTPKQLVNNTIAVITIVLITAIIVFALDVIFETMNNYGVNRLKQVVESYNEQTETDTNQNAESAVNNILNEENNSDENEESTDNTNVNSTENE